MSMGAGSAKSNATTEPTITGVQVQTCLYNLAIPLLIGKRRAAAEVIWYGYFGPGGGSGKKGKASKKSGISDYQANLDLLIGYGPLWNIINTYQNASLYGYDYPKPSAVFAHVTNQTTAVTAEDFTENADGTFTYTGSVTAPSGYILDFIYAISFVPTAPLSTTVDDYGDPTGEHTLTEEGLATAWNSGTSYVVGNVVSYQGFNWRAIAPSTNETPSDIGGFWTGAPNESEQWLYNTYFNPATIVGNVDVDNPSETPLTGVANGTYAWRPGSWMFGQPLCNSDKCAFPIGNDNAYDQITNTNGTTSQWSITLLSAQAGDIFVYYGYHKENHHNPLEFIKYEFEPVLGSGNEYIPGSQQSQLDQQIYYPELSGVAGVAVDLGASGMAPELDIEPTGLYSLTKSGQANPADLILDLILSGNVFDTGAAGFSPLCFSHGLNFAGDPLRQAPVIDGFAEDGGTFPYPPIVAFPWTLPGDSSNPGYFLGGPFSILKDAPVFNQGPWAGSGFSASTKNTGTTGDNQSAALTPKHSTDYAFFAVNYGSSAPAGWLTPTPGLYALQLSSTSPINPAVSNALGEDVWANVLATVAASGAVSITNSSGWGSGGIGSGAHDTTLTVVKGQAIVAYVGQDSTGLETAPLTVTDSIGTDYTVLSASANLAPSFDYTVGAWLWIGFAKESGTITITMTLPAPLNNIGDSGVFAYSGLVEGSSGIYPIGSVVMQSGAYYQAVENSSSLPGSDESWTQVDASILSDGISDVRNYCTANSIFVSMYLKSQRECSEVLSEICEIANCTPVWNGQGLDFYPYSEVSAVGGGVVYTPRTAAGPLARFDYRHLVTSGSTAPVIVKQENMQSVANILDINYADAGFGSNGMSGYPSYQSNSVRICDAEHCQLYGPMVGSPRGYDDYICDPGTATTVGWPIIKRQRYADPYSAEFSLPASIASLLDPMDLITIADPVFGGLQPNGVTLSGSGCLDVRIIDLEEDSEGKWQLTAERFLYGMSAPNVPSFQSSTPNPPADITQGAGAVNPPYFFEPTVALAQALGMAQTSGLAIAVSSSATNYGGCQVWVSTDGGESYSEIGTLLGSSDMGATTADYPEHANPDGADTLSVDLTESNGTLQSYTAAQQSQLISIALVDQGGESTQGGYTTAVPYEIVAYKTATMTAAYKYSMPPSILRGQLGTAPADHPYNPSLGLSVFVNLVNPNSVFKTQIPSGNILGNTLYFKFPSFNQFTSAVQDISDCTPYTFSLTGATLPGGTTGGSSYTISPNPCLYQGRSGGWAGVDSGSTSWTTADDIYFPSITVNYNTGAVTYAANDAGTAAFTGPNQTVFVCIYDPSHTGGTPTVDIQSTNEHAIISEYVYLGSITSAAVSPVSPGGTGGSSGTGGPQDPGGIEYEIFFDGEPAV